MSICGPQKNGDTSLSLRNYKCFERKWLLLKQVQKNCYRGISYEEFQSALAPGASIKALIIRSAVVKEAKDTLIESSLSNVIFIT